MSHSAATLRPPFHRVIRQAAAWGGLVAGMAAGGIAGVRGGAAEGVVTGLLASATAVAAVCLGGVAYVVVPGGRAGSAAAAALAGSLGRAAMLVAAGLGVQYACAPEPGGFWLGLGLGWVAMKAAELRTLLPVFNGGAARAAAGAER